MPDVSSNWKITLDPDGEALVLVDYGQRMSDELTWGWKQVVDEVKKQGGTTDHFPRGNVTGPVSFGSYKDHADDAAAREWMALLFVALNDFTGARTTLKVEIQGGDIFTVSNVVLEEAPTKMVPTAPVARTLTTWKLRAGTWALSGTAGPEAPESESLNSAIVNVSGNSGALEAGGVAAEIGEAVATWSNGGTGSDLTNPSSTERPSFLGFDRDGLYLPGVAGNAFTVTGATDFNFAATFSQRIDACLPDYRPASAVCLASRWTETGDQRSWRALLNTDGTVTLEWSTDGTAATIASATSTVALPLGAWEYLGISIRKSADSGGFVTFEIYTDYESTSPYGLGAAVTGTGSTAPFASSAPLQIGAYNAGTGAPAQGVFFRFVWWRTSYAVDQAISSGRVFLTDTEPLEAPWISPYSSTPWTIDRADLDPARKIRKAVLRFDGSDDDLALATAAPLNAVTGATLAWYGTLNRVSGTQDLIYCASNDADPRLLLRMNAASIELHVRRTDAEAAATISYATGWSAYQEAVIIAVVDYASGFASIYVDAALVASGTLTSAGTTDATDSTATRIMGGAAGNPAAGDVNHVVIKQTTTPFSLIRAMYDAIVEASR